MEDRGPVVLITHPRDRLLATRTSHVVKGPDRVEVRTWSEVQVTSVRYRVDDDGYVAMDLRDDGLWSGHLEGDRLAKGEHVLAVVVATEVRETVRCAVPNGSPEVP